MSYEKLFLHIINDYNNTKKAYFSTMEIKFTWGGTFAGAEFFIEIEGEDKRISLGIINTDDEAKLAAIKMIKDKYNIDLSMDDIKFEWNGTL